MAKAAFDKIKAGMEDAIAYAQGDDTRATIHIPEDIDVKVIRSKLKMTQRQFSKGFGIGIDRVQDWEQNRSVPTEAMRAYLTVINREPEAVRRALTVGSEKRGSRNKRTRRVLRPSTAA